MNQISRRSEFTIHCFQYCVKEGRAVENTESEAATWKIVTTMQSW